MKDQNKKIVPYVKEGMDRHDVFCTTYQMRDFYIQLHDGYFNMLEYMNWLQHIHCLKYIKKGAVVVDLCCGRGLMLPLIKRNKKHQIRNYIGIDISEKNIYKAKTRHGMRHIEYTKYYPFPVAFYKRKSSDITRVLLNDIADLIIFLASVEHMHKDEACQTLDACYDVLKPGGTLIISTPNTNQPRDDGYECQYRAHVYEWNLRELSWELEQIGFKIDNLVGLMIRKRDIPWDTMPPEKAQVLRNLEQYLPYDIFCCIAACSYPGLSKEVLIVAKKPKAK